MNHHFLDLDHLLTRVDDPQAAGERFERLGFRVTPISHLHSMGVANRLMLFDPLVAGAANFIELMGVGDPARLTSSMAAVLDGPDGIRSLVISSEDAAASRASLASAGYGPGDVHRVGREWVLDGEVLPLAFDVLLPMAAPLTFNVCRYHTLPPYLRPAWRAHPNGVRRVSAVYGVVESAAEAAAWFERLLGVTASSPAPDWHLLGHGGMQLAIATPAAFAHRFGAAPGREGLVGYRLLSKDIGLTRRVFAEAGVMPEPVAGEARAGDDDATGAGFVVGPDVGFGNWIEVVPAPLAA